VYFEIGSHIETIAVGRSIQEIDGCADSWARTVAQTKGNATVSLRGRIHKVELHWYEAHGIGKDKDQTFLGLVK
jgi:hypothetical protein